MTSEKPLEHFLSGTRGYTQRKKEGRGRFPKSVILLVLKSNAVKQIQNSVFSYLFQFCLSVMRNYKILSYLCIFHKKSHNEIFNRHWNFFNVSFFNTSSILLTRKNCFCLFTNGIIHVVSNAKSDSRLFELE